MKSLPLWGQPPGREPHGLPLLRLGFRPFYLLAAVAGVVLMPLWWAVFTGRLAPASGLSPVLWHAHEMLFGLVTAVVVGFLFTAGKTWTGLDTPRGGHLLFFALLWLAGRLAALLAPYPVFFLIDLVFLLLSAATFADLILRSNNTRNLIVAVILALLGAANLWFHLGASGALDLDPLAALHAGLAVLVLLETLIAGRVVPFFARSVTPGLRNEVSIGRERALAVSTALGLLAWLLDAHRPLTVALLLAAAGLHVWRLHTWRPWATLRRPLLWSLYLAYAWIPVGLALLALAMWQRGSLSPALHAFAVGATAGLILAMMTRTARGHTGRPLTVGRAESAAYALIAVAALLRVGVPLLLPRLYRPGLIAAGLCFAAAFLIYVVVYTPLLTTTRADGRDG